MSSSARPAAAHTPPPASESVDVVLSVFATLPPGTVSPLMASSLVGQRGRRQLLLGHLRRRAREDAVLAAAAAARAGAEAAEAASRVAASEPGQATAETTSVNARRAQDHALATAGDADSAAYHLSRLRRVPVDQLPTRRFAPKPRPTVAARRS